MQVNKIDTQTMTLTLACATFMASASIALSAPSVPMSAPVSAVSGLPPSPTIQLDGGNPVEDYNGSLRMFKSAVSKYPAANIRIIWGVPGSLETV